MPPFPPAYAAAFADGRRLRKRPAPGAAGWRVGRTAITTRGPVWCSRSSRARRVDDRLRRRRPVDRGRHADRAGHHRVDPGVAGVADARRARDRGRVTKSQRRPPLRRGGAAGTAPLPANRPRRPAGPGLGARPPPVRRAAERLRRLRVRPDGGAAAARPRRRLGAEHRAVRRRVRRGAGPRHRRVPRWHARPGVRRGRRPGPAGLARRPPGGRADPALRLPRRAGHRRAGDQAPHHGPRFRQRRRAHSPPTAAPAPSWPSSTRRA